MSQGKEWNQQEVIEILEPLFKLGYTVNKACNIAGIPQSTVATWVTADEELRLKITMWQNELSIKARKQWAKAIELGRETSFGVDTYSPAKDWLERVEKEVFSLKQETDNTNKNVDIPVDESLPVEQRLQKVLEDIKRLQEA